jgi:hypothetical protein
MKIDITEQFELLPKAPIVEAVIQIHARPESPWDENEIVGSLKPKIPEYTKTVSQISFSESALWRLTDKSGYGYGIKASGLKVLSVDRNHLLQVIKRASNSPSSTKESVISAYATTARETKSMMIFGTSPKKGSVP